MKQLTKTCCEFCGKPESHNVSHDCSRILTRNNQRAMKHKYDTETIEAIIRYIKIKTKNTNNIDVKAHFMSLIAHLESFLPKA